MSAYSVLEGLLAGTGVGGAALIGFGIFRLIRRFLSSDCVRTASGPAVIIGLQPPTTIEAATAPRRQSILAESDTKRADP